MTTKLTAPWNLGYLAGYERKACYPYRADWDAEQRTAYAEGHSEGEADRHAWETEQTDKAIRAIVTDATRVHRGIRSA